MSLELSIEKTKAILIGPKKLRNRPPIVKLNNKKIEFLEYLQLLGITLDMTLNFIQHAANIRSKIAFLSNKYARVAPKPWGLSGAILKIWYTSVVEAKICYAALAWGGKLGSDASRQLISAQRQALLRITRTYCQAPTAALNNLIGIPPINLTIKRRFVTAFLTNFQTDTEFLGHRIKYSDYQFPIKISDQDTSVLSPLYIDTQPITTPISEISIYTDGSSRAEGVSSAFCVFTKENLLAFEDSAVLRPQNSIFQAELYAIHLAITWFIHSQFSSVNIYSDSKSALQALEVLRTKDTQVQKLHELIMSVANEKTINLLWVKGHSGVPGNERADLLAHNALLPTTYIQTLIPFPMSGLRKLLRTRVLHSWQEEWDAGMTGRETYKYLPKVSYDHKYFNYAVNAFLTGHGCFPSYLFKIKKLSSPNCDCGRRGTPTHYLFSCPLYPSVTRSIPSVANLPIWTKKLMSNKPMQRKFEELYSQLRDRYEWIGRRN